MDKIQLPDTLMEIYMCEETEMLRNHLDNGFHNLNMSLHINVSVLTYNCIWKNQFRIRRF